MYEIISDNETLAQLCQQWQSLDFLAVDTEFVRTSTFFPREGLIQVGDGTMNYLIDPLSVSEFGPLKAVFENSSVTKILHSCSEDLDLFLHFLGVLPSPVFDTQIAAAFLGAGFALSYQRLVQHYLDIEVSKDETRSDWRQRPLSEKQLHYAALDVEHLGPIYEMQRGLLEEQGKLPWALNDCAALSANCFANHQSDRYYLRVKSAWRLDQRQLAVLRQLCIWREKKARDEDVPRGRVVKDSALCQIAAGRLSSVEEFSVVEDLTPGLIRKFGAQIVAAIEAAAPLSLEECPPAIEGPISSGMNKLIKEMKGIVLKIAEQQGLALELLMRKKDYEALVRSGARSGEYCLPETMSDWRRQIVGQPLLNWLENR